MVIVLPCFVLRSLLKSAVNTGGRNRDITDNFAMRNVTHWQIFEFVPITLVTCMQTDIYECANSPTYLQRLQFDQNTPTHAYVWRTIHLYIWARSASYCKLYRSKKHLHFLCVPVQYIVATSFLSLPSITEIRCQN